MTTSCMTVLKASTRKYEWQRKDTHFTGICTQSLSMYGERAHVHQGQDEEEHTRASSLLVWLLVNSRASAILSAASNAKRQPAAVGADKAAIAACLQHTALV